MSKPQQSFEQFITYYELIHRDAATEYRLIRAGKTKSLVSNPDDLEADFERLARLNNNGWNIYSVVNQVDTAVLAKIASRRPWHERDDAGNLKLNSKGEPKRYFATQNHHITGINALFVDLDNPPEGNLTNLGLLQNAALSPSQIVQTSLEYKLQAYWLVEDGAFTPAEFKHVQRQLTKLFNGDKAVTNSARVLRIPGFLHVKDVKNPIQSQLLESNGIVYSRDELLSAFELDPTPPKPVSLPVNPAFTSGDWAKVVDAFERWEPVDGERRNVTLRTMNLACRLGVPQAEAIAAITDIKQRVWGADDALESTQGCADWSYSQGDLAEVGALVSTLERDYGLEIGVLDAVKRQRVVKAINCKAQLDPAQFDKVIDVNARYLSDVGGDVRKQLPDGPAVIVLQNPVGGGKSTMLREEFADSDSVVFVTPLVELCTTTARKTQSTNYKKLNDDDYRHYSSSYNHRLTITPNSWSKLNKSTAINGDDDSIFIHRNAVLDESDAIVSRLSDSDVTNEQSMYYALKTHIAGGLLQGGRVYLSSAYHQQSELTLVKQVLDELRADFGLDVPVILVRNEYQPAMGCTYELLEVDADKGVSKQKALRAA
ncbi:MAG: DNA-primase RepB domain-containing protein, partial [Deinococcota bacterium]